MNLLNKIIEIEEYFKAFKDNLYEGVITFQAEVNQQDNSIFDFKVIYHNPALKIILEEEKPSLIGLSAASLFKDFSNNYLKYFEQAYKTGHNQALELTNNTTNRKYRLTITKNYQKQLEVLIQNIVDDIEYQQKIAHWTTHDMLTGLLNRFSFPEILKNKIEAAKNFKNTVFLIMFLDLDNLKEVNHTFNHSYGDKLIKEAGKALKRALNKNDLISHRSGDEFIFMTDISKRDSSKLNLTEVEEKINIITSKVDREIKKIRIKKDGQVIKTAASIGVSIYPWHSRNAHVLIDYSDKAMYQSKKTNSTEDRKLYIIYQKPSS